MEYNLPSELIKQLDFGQDAKSKIIAGVQKLAQAVKSTLGASGKCVIYEDARGMPVITKDGVTVAQSVVLYDPVENIGATLIKEAASNTVKEAGDGTTTATVLVNLLGRLKRVLALVWSKLLSILKRVLLKLKEICFNLLALLAATMIVSLEALLRKLTRR